MSLLVIKPPPRYIEVRLTKFALDVVFNNKITNWISSYDGRGKEPFNITNKVSIVTCSWCGGLLLDYLRK